jgi:hypothetical protein
MPLSANYHLVPSAASLTIDCPGIRARLRGHCPGRLWQCDVRGVIESRLGVKTVSVVCAISIRLSTHDDGEPEGRTASLPSNVDNAALRRVPVESEAEAKGSGYA